jgi:hypothetical protein
LNGGGQPKKVAATPSVALGCLHKDHSDDENDLDDENDSIESFTDLTPTPQPSLDEPVAATKPSSSLFPATSFLIDPNVRNEKIPITNVMLPLSKLIEFMNDSFKCRSCSAVGKSFVVERYGIAASLFFKCKNCGFETNCRADLCEVLEDEWSKKPPGKKFKDSKVHPVNGSDFELNRKLYLATQQNGGGVKEAKTFAGLLGLHSNALAGRWSLVAEKMGLEIIELGKEILDKNILIEMELSPSDDDVGQKTIQHVGIVVGTSALPEEDTTVSPGALS